MKEVGMKIIFKGKVSKFGMMEVHFTMDNFLKEKRMDLVS